MSDNQLADWIHDDRTWCADYGCIITECYRNPNNMRNPVGVHSFAVFRETDQCPIYQMEHHMEVEQI